MTYVMSDIHGEYTKYLTMLDIIGFRETDTLYVLGDVVDRGPEPLKILMDMMNRANVFPLMGNHDLCALAVFELYKSEASSSIFVVMGHTPTPYFTGKAEIYNNGRNIFIDCGACSPKGKLACLSLETQEEFYV